jgi:hypothetical protein
MRVSLGGVEVALEAESLERVEGGIRLLGKEVRVYPPFPARAFFRHGWQSWSLTAWVDLKGGQKAPLPGGAEAPGGRPLPPGVLGLVG